jgi:ribonuclease P protein component
VLLIRARNDGDPAMRLGLTVSKKVGNAVVRNRMKRRFRELARKILPEAGHEGADHVLIGRQSGIERDYALLADELEKALNKLTGRTVRPRTGSGAVEAPPFSSAGKQEKASTSSARTEPGGPPASNSDSGPER